MGVVGFSGIIPPSSNPLSRCKDFFWVHTPKTGSTFCMSLNHICCASTFEKSVENVTLADIAHLESLKASDRPYDFLSGYGCIYFHRKGDKDEKCFRYFSSHYPYFELPNAVPIGIFRHPKSRLISSFLDGLHHEGMTLDEFDSLKEQINNASMGISDIDLSTKIKFEVYASSHFHLGCQTKMILGYHCSYPLFDREHFNQSALSMAISRLRSFAFVGIFEEYNRSVSLLHAMANVSTSPHLVELYPRRTTFDRPIRKYLFTNVVISDPYDEPLYYEARQAFKALTTRYFV